MNYIRIYNNIIISAKNRIPSLNEYYEKHHIIMKSHGGNDKQENIVLLTAREHFLSHWLLWKIFKDRSSAHAWWSMVRNNKSNKRVGKRNISSRFYELAKKAMIEKSKGKKLSIETKKRISLNSARKGKPNWNSGLKWKKKKYKQTLTQEHKLNISNANKGCPKPKLICPFCKKVGGAPQMKRHHFNNCKEKYNGTYCA